MPALGFSTSDIFLSAGRDIYMSMFTWPIEFRSTLSFAEGSRFIDAA